MTGRKDRGRRASIGMARARLAAAPMLLLVAACSVASDHRQPIAQFAAAAEKAETALADFDKGAAAELTALRRADAIASPGRVGHDDGDCRPRAKRCRVTLLPDLAGNDGGGPLTVSSIVPGHLQAMREIRLYAEGLRDIVAADATGAVKAGLDKASAAAAQLASLAGAQYGAAVRVFSVPATHAAAWLFGAYQESIKIRALREASARMETVLPAAVAEFGRAADLAHLANVTHLFESFGDRQLSFDDEASAANLDAYLQAARRLDDALQVKPSDVFQQLGVAHSELAAALRADDITFEQALLQIDRLGTKVEELAAIAKAFAAAGSGS